MTIQTKKNNAMLSDQNESEVKNVQIKPVAKNPL